MQFGVENIKKALSVVLGIAQSINNAQSDDGKISWLEALGMIGKVFPIAELVNNRHQLVAELNDLEESEKQALYDWVRVQYSVANEQATITVHRSIQLFLDILDFALEMSTIWKKK